MNENEYESNVLHPWKPFHKAENQVLGNEAMILFELSIMRMQPGLPGSNQLCTPADLILQ